MLNTLTTLWRARRLHAAEAELAGIKAKIGYLTGQTTSDDPRVMRLPKSMVFEIAELKRREAVLQVRIDFMKQLTAGAVHVEKAAD